MHKESARDRHGAIAGQALGTCRGFGGKCEGCGEYAWHTETLKKVQRDRWDTGEVHVGARDVGCGGRDTWKRGRICRKTWKDRCGRTAGGETVGRHGGTWQSMWKHGGDVGI